jgi:hypothetical protein
MSNPFSDNHKGTERSHPVGSGVQWKFKFPNGYGASVVQFSLAGGFGGSYGSESGLWELAVLNADGSLNYDTPITSDVLGYLDEGDVAATLDAIAALPTHARAAS